MPRFQLLANAGALSVLLFLPGCGDWAADIKDLSDFTEFRMKIVSTSPTDCPCTQCPPSAQILRQADGGYLVTFQGVSRALTSDESDRLNNIFHKVEFPNALFSCLIEGRQERTCIVSFSWDTLPATNYPCAAGAVPLTTQQTAEIMGFLEEIASPP